MLPKSKASPYIVTLILSFVLSSYINNLLRIKLKPCIAHCGGISLLKFLAYLLTLGYGGKSSRIYPQRNHSHKR